MNNKSLQDVNYRNKEVLEIYDEAFNKYYGIAIGGMNKALYGTPEPSRMTYRDRVGLKLSKWQENIQLAWESIRGKHDCY